MGTSASRTDYCIDIGRFTVADVDIGRFTVADVDIGRFTVADVDIGRFTVDGRATDRSGRIGE